MEQPGSLKSTNIEMAGSSEIPPPVYENAISAPSAENPPSYESLTIINKLRKARKESNNPIEYLFGACAIIFGSGKT